VEEAVRMVAADKALGGILAATARINGEGTGEYTHVAGCVQTAILWFDWLLICFMEPICGVAGVD
jgi:hypothetical protein